MRSFRDKKGISYKMLHDSDGETFERYGIRNERHDKTVPHPTVVVVDQEQRVRAVFSDENYRKRPPANEVLNAVRAVAEVDKALTKFE